MDITVIEQRLEYILDTYPEVAEQYMSGDDVEFCARLEDLCANSNFDIKTFSVESLYSSGAVSGTSWDKIKPKTSNIEPPDDIFRAEDTTPAQGTIADEDDIIDLFGSDDDISTSAVENSLDCQDNSALFNSDVENPVESSVNSVNNSRDSVNFVENSVESVENQGINAGQAVESAGRAVENLVESVETPSDNVPAQGTTDSDDLSAMFSAAFSDVEMKKSVEELPIQHENDEIAVHSSDITYGYDVDVSNSESVKSGYTSNAPDSRGITSRHNADVQASEEITPGYTAPTFNDLDDLLCNTFYTLPSSTESSAPDEPALVDTPDDEEQDEEVTEWGINEIAPDVIFEVNTELGAANTEFLDTKLREFIAADVTLVPDLESMCFDPGLQNYFSSYLASLDDDLAGLCEDLNDLQNLINLDNAGLLSSQEHTIFTKWGTPYAKVTVPESQRASLPKIEDRTVVDYSKSANTNIIAPPVLDDNISHADTPSADLSALFPGYNLDAANRGIADDMDDASDLFDDNDELDELENREYDISAIVHEQGIISAPPSNLDDDFDEVEDEDSVEDTPDSDDDIFDDVEDADSSDEDDLFDDQDEDSDLFDDNSDDLDEDSDLVTDADLFDDVSDDSNDAEDEDDSDLFDDEDSIDQSEGITIPSIQVDFDACPYPEDSPEFAKWVTAEYNKRVAEIAAQVKDRYSVDMSDYSADDADFDDEDDIDSSEMGTTSDSDDTFDDEDSMFSDESDEFEAVDESDSNEGDFDELDSNDDDFDELDSNEADEFDELDDSTSGDIDDLDDLDDSASDDTDEFDDVADSDSGTSGGTADEFDDPDDSDLFSSYYGNSSSGNTEIDSSDDDDFDDDIEDSDTSSSDSEDDFDDLPDKDEGISTDESDAVFDEVDDFESDDEFESSDEEFDDIDESADSDEEFDDMDEPDDSDSDDEFDDLDGSEDSSDSDFDDSDEQDVDDFDDVSETGTIDDPLDSFYGTSSDDFDDPEEPADDMASTWDDEIADNFDDIPDDDDPELGDSYNRESEDDLDDLYDSVDSFLDSQPDDSSFSTNPVNASDRGVPASAIKKVPVTIEEKNEAAADAILSMFNKLKASPSAAKSVLDNIFSKEDN